MSTRLPSLRNPPIGFAHRGARAHALENTLDAFRLAVRLGATGLETDVWLTADGEPVCDHDGAVGRRFRRRSITELRRDELQRGDPLVGRFPFGSFVHEAGASEARKRGQGDVAVHGLV